MIFGKMLKFWEKNFEKYFSLEILHFCCGIMSKLFFSTFSFWVYFLFKNVHFSSFSVQKIKKCSNFGIFKFFFFEKSHILGGGDFLTFFSFFHKVFFWFFLNFLKKIGNLLWNILCFKKFKFCEKSHFWRNEWLDKYSI